MVALTVMVFLLHKFMYFLYIFKKINDVLDPRGKQGWIPVGNGDKGKIHPAIGMGADERIGDGER